MTLVQAGVIEFGVPLAITVFLVTWLSQKPADRAARTRARPPVHDI
jgi:hypothetical protein